MREAGHSPTARLGFDLAVRSVKRWADAREQETESVPAPAASKHPTVERPKYRTLRDLLALDAGDAVAADGFDDLDLSRFAIPDEGG